MILIYIYFQFEGIHFQEKHHTITTTTNTQLLLFSNIQKHVKNATKTAPTADENVRERVHAARAEHCKKFCVDDL